MLLCRLLTGNVKAAKGLGSSERTEAQWKDLFGKAGLEIRGLWWEEEGTKGKKALMELGLKK